MKSHIVFNVFMYALVIAYILYINFATYYNSGTNFLNFLIKLFNNWVFRLIFLLIVGFFALDLFPYGGFIFAILLTIAFLNTNMLVYKKEISESFVGGINSATFEPIYKKNDDKNIESYVDYDENRQTNILNLKERIRNTEYQLNDLKMTQKNIPNKKEIINSLENYLENLRIKLSLFENK